MSYADYLATLPPDDCIFCSEVYRSTAVRSYEHWMVAPNRWPYAPDHLMIVPHAHMERADEIPPEAWAEIPAITREAGAWLERRGYLGYSFLLRDEAELGAVGKSIPHLHIHLVPGIFIGPGQKWGFTKRPFMDEEELAATVAEIKESWLW